MHRILRPALAVVVVVVLGACDRAGDSAPSDVAVEVEGYRFPDPIAIAPGGTVTFTTVDAEPHRVQADDGTFESSAFGPGQEATVDAPATPGSYPFTCVLHPTMEGALTVG
jgi:plastocyanin